MIKKKGALKILNYICLSVIVVFSLMTFAGCGGGEDVATGSNGNGNYNISGYIFDASYSVNTNTPISEAVISINEYSTQSDNLGYFSLDYYGVNDPIVEINADGYEIYEEKPSRMLNDAFYLIPSGQVYNDFSILCWNIEDSNPNNWHRKWDRQTEFYIIKNQASDQQINDLISILEQDEYSKMTGGLYSSKVSTTVLDKDPNWTPEEKKGKTKIYFSDGIISGGIAHSEDGDDGIIDYAEIGWDTNQELDDNVVWHEISHTVTAGGHINYRASVNSETMGGGYVFPEDEKAFNCIYNSPPKRDN